MNMQDENVILLDDETSVRQRVAGILVLVVILIALAIPIGRGFDAAAEPEPAVEQGRQQTVLDMCGPWSVPDALESIASLAYPSWNWVCRLVQP